MTKIPCSKMFSTQILLVHKSCSIVFYYVLFNVFTSKRPHSNYFDMKFSAFSHVLGIKLRTTFIACAKTANFRLLQLARWCRTSASTIDKKQVIGWFSFKLSYYCLSVNRKFCFLILVTFFYIIRVNLQIWILLIFCLSFIILFVIFNWCYAITVF